MLNVLNIPEALRHLRLVCCSDWRYSLTNYLAEYTYLHMLLKLEVNLGITEFLR